MILSAVLTPADLDGFLEELDYEDAQLLILPSGPLGQGIVQSLVHPNDIAVV